MTTRRILPLLLCLASPAFAGDKDWIGRVVPPNPDGLASNVGACVGSGVAPDEICAYSIATLDDAKGRGLYLYSGREAPRVGNDPRWMITAVIAYPKLRRLAGRSD